MSYKIKPGTRSRTAKFTCEQVKEIRNKKASGSGDDELMKEYNLSKSALVRMVKRITYGDCK